MNFSLNDLRTRQLRLRGETASHGNARIVDFLIEDDKWTLRFFVVHHEIEGEKEKVLVSPVGIRRIDEDSDEIELLLDNDDLADCPLLESVETASEHNEKIFHNVYREPSFVQTSAAAAQGTFPHALPRDLALSPQDAADGLSPLGEGHQLSHLRSFNELVAYRVEVDNARIAPEDIATLRDITVDTQDWKILEFLASTDDRWGGEPRYLVPTQIWSVNWAERVVKILTPLRSSSEFSDSTPEANEIGAGETLAPSALNPA